MIKPPPEGNKPYRRRFSFLAGVMTPQKKPLIGAKREGVWGLVLRLGVWGMKSPNVPPSANQKDEGTGNVGLPPKPAWGAAPNPARDFIP